MLSTEILYKEHKMIGRFLKVLEGAAKRQKEGRGSLPPDFYKKAVDFSQVYIEKLHQGKEETVLVMGLEERGLSRTANPMAEILSEHQKVKEQIAQFSAEVEKLAGGDPSVLPRLADAFMAFKALYEGHMKKEEGRLYSFADESYSDVEHESTIQVFVDYSKKIGEGIHQTYKKVVEDLEKTVAG
jgi:hemerythrin-like domain-containing protein